MASMFGGLGSLIGGKMEANNVGNAIDAKLEAMKASLKVAVREVNSFDDIEADMATFANQLRTEAPQLAQVFDNLVRQVDRKQGTIKEAIGDAVEKANQIDGLTNKIQL